MWRKGLTPERIEEIERILNRPSRQQLQASASIEARDAGFHGWNPYTGEQTFWAAPSDCWMIPEDMEDEEK